MINSQILDYFFMKDRIIVKTGDITTEKSDAIVNAANASLMGGGGVDGAIHRRGGEDFLAECKKVRKLQWPDGLPEGQAVITGAGNLPSNYVIHTVGPIWLGGTHKESEKLASCYRESLKLATVNSLESIVFPAISTGAFGYPPDKAAVVSSKAVQKFLLENEVPQKVIFIFLYPEEMSIFLEHCIFKK
jgi:O-acetyl-ADP-ribose deacetylase (regulator of RNase III)